MVILVRRDDAREQAAAAAERNENRHNERPPRAAPPPAPRPPGDAQANNDGDADQADEQQQLPLLHSLEHYIRTRGIAPVDDGAVQQADAFYADPNHAQNRQVEDDQYQESVHRAAFAEYDIKEHDEKVRKRQFLGTLKGQTIAVLSAKEGEDDAEADASCSSTCATSDDERKSTCSTSVPLDTLASSCDTVYTMVRSDRTLWSRQNSAALSDVEDANVENEESKSNNWHQSTLDLTNFRSGPVESFLSVIMKVSKDASKSENDDDDGHISLANIPPHHIVDLCLISHYLQCASVLETTIDVLKESVDSDNCLSMCRLADQLGSPSLFEASVAHLIEKLDDMQNHDEWEGFPVTLRNRVVTMRNAVHSSIIGRGQKTSVFFSSSDEFLAIFSDNLREQRERLAEAKRRQEEIVSDRIRNPSGRHRDPYGGSVKDAEIKIERQEQRLQTLETFYKEQKLIFSGGGGNGLGGSNAAKVEKQPFQLGYS
mmetsp:Transcript_1883/g.5485  ORF Transcript_1883/g.5485 Transcript_1883/m.5485 type:complete len:486 (-) Transcript_1883:90-1547(-)